MNAVEKKNCQVSESAVSTQLGLPFSASQIATDTFRYFKWLSPLSDTDCSTLDCIRGT